VKVGLAAARRAALLLRLARLALALLPLPRLAAARTGGGGGGGGGGDVLAKRLSRLEVGLEQPAVAAVRVEDLEAEPAGGIDADSDHIGGAKGARLLAARRAAARRRRARLDAAVQELGRHRLVGRRG